MNINDMISPQARAKVYLALGIAGLVLGAFGAGIGAFAASGFNAPLVVGALLSAANAVYAFLAGAFNFVAKANTPTDDTLIVGLPDRPVNRENVDAHKEAMLGELTEQNIRDIQDALSSVPTEDQWTALTVEDEDEDA